jgi:uncharacterized protein YggE
MKFILSCLIIFSFYSAAAQTRYINITGNSEIIKKADQAEFSVFIKTIGKSIEASKVENDKHLVDLLVILQNMNIPSDAIQISPLTFGKNYEQGERGMKHDGYFTSVNASFTLNNLKRYYDITHRLSGNDAFEISAVYSISDYELQNKKAFEKALEAAEEKAKYMAGKLGLKTGQVLEIEENNAAQPYLMSVNTTSREIEAGSITGNVSIKRSVRIKYELISETDE